jgi:hypothetical protein
MITRNEVIQRLCKLLSDVADKETGWDHQTDCICGMVKDPLGREPMQDGAALEVIERVVREHLEAVLRERARNKASYPIGEDK